MAKLNECPRGRSSAIDNMSQYCVCLDQEADGSPGIACFDSRNGIGKCVFYKERVKNMAKTEFTKTDILDMLDDTLRIYAKECADQMFEDTDILAEADIISILRCAKAREEKARKSFAGFHYY
jgi:hypothetical protein